MSRFSESDWELVNAFHDGELSDEEAAEFERRLSTEPELEHALEQVAGMSQSLKALRPPTLDVVPTAKKTPVVRYWLGGMAAAVAAVAFVMWSAQPRAASLLDFHLVLQQASFSVSAQDVRDVALTQRLGVHDLTGANLAPVSAQAIPNGTLAHYAGLNGCRLSYFKVDRAFELPSGQNVQAIAWTTADGAHHAIVATGMDVAKFEAIATYLQHVTHDLAKPDVYASMSEATQSAAPCVG